MDAKCTECDLVVNKDAWKLELLLWIKDNSTHPDETNKKRILVSSLLTKIHKM